MALAKTSTFLFFLIIGTSVLPNSSSTGLAYAKPFDAEVAMSFLPKALDIFSRRASQEPAHASSWTNKHYGHVNRIIGKSIYTNNGKGGITYGRSTVIRDYGEPI